MLLIQNTLVSLDLIEQFFCCDLEACHGQCCIDGDAGAPITEEEKAKIEEVLPLVYDNLLPGAKAEIEEHGVSYVDVEGDLVTSIVRGGCCVFCHFDKGGMCLCELERAYRQGLTDFVKPMSCRLYPVRLRQVKDFIAVNYHRWNICKSAEVIGRAKGIRAYEFLREPLIARFGQEWYDELELTAREYLAQYGN